MKKPAAELDEAAQEWLDCYDARKKYVAATKKLFCAFAAGWNGPRRDQPELNGSLQSPLPEAPASASCFGILKFGEFLNWLCVRWRILVQ